MLKDRERIQSMLTRTADMHLSPQGPSGPCWCFWSAGKWYPRVKYGNRVEGGHRAIVCFLRGFRGLPRDQQVHHLCGNRLCVNPAHLAVLPKSLHTFIHYLELSPDRRTVDAYVLRRFCPQLKCPVKRRDRKSVGAACSCPAFSMCARNRSFEQLTAERLSQRQEEPVERHLQRLRPALRHYKALRRRGRKKAGPAWRMLKMTPEFIRIMGYEATPPAHQLAQPSCKGARHGKGSA